MIDENRDENENETLALEEEDRLPWLEPVDDVADDNVVSPGRLIGLVLAGLGALALLVGAIWWMQNRNNNADGQGELIAAAEGDYKVAPAESGAKQFAGEGDASYKTSEGAEVQGKIDPSKAPEAPAVGKAGIVAATPKVAANAKTAPAKAGDKAAAVSATKSASATPTATAANSGAGVVQLGAFNSQATADKAWAQMQKRYAVLSGMGKTVTAASVGGGTVYRLRAASGSAEKANSICSTLKAAGENCMVVR